MCRLVDYVLRELYGEEPGPDSKGEPALRLLDLVLDRTARLAASYMAAGFVHGVLNSDNINVTGESFDYGPWRFAPTWDPAFTAAYFDHQGLYAFGRQPEAIHWDVMQLAVALRLIVDSEPLIAALDGFAPAYGPAVTAAILWRLGVVPQGDAGDRALVQAIERAFRATEVPLDRFFFDAFGGALPSSYGAEWDEVRAAFTGYFARKDRDHPYWSGVPCAMLIDEVEAIWKAIAEEDDWGPFEAKVAAIRRMGEAHSIGPDGEG